MMKGMRRRVMVMMILMDNGEWEMRRGRVDMMVDMMG